MGKFLYSIGSSIADYTLSYFRKNLLLQLSYKDEMTKCFNRNAFIQDKQKMQEKLNNDKNNLSVGCIFIDVNNLKRINDSFGHSKGDELIKNVGNILNEQVIKNFNVYRPGGDEFVILGCGVSEEKYEEMLYSIKQSFNEKKDLSVAIGSYYDDKPKSIDEVVRIADDEMYKIKIKMHSRNTF